MGELIDGPTDIDLLVVLVELEGAVLILGTALDTEILEIAVTTDDKLPVVPVFMVVVEDDCIVDAVKGFMLEDPAVAEFEAEFGIFDVDIPVEEEDETCGFKSETKTAELSPP